MKGLKTGGRRKGTPNKDKQLLLDEIQQKFPDYHPVIAMAEIANDEDADPGMRFSAHKEIAQYVTPKLKSVEQSVNMQEIVVNVTEKDLRL